MAAAVGMGSGDHLPSFCSREGLVNFAKGPRLSILGMGERALFQQPNSATKVSR